jgi:CRISPR-associated endoribonuclease Cas6
VIAPALTQVQLTGQPGRQQFNPGDEVSFELILIGRAQEFFPYFVVALREVDRIGRGRRTVELQRIEALPAVSGEARVVYDASDNLVRGGADSITLEDCAALPLPQAPLTIEFLTQTRLKHEGRFIRQPIFQVVFRRLLGRLSSLARFHCSTPLEVDFRGLIEQAASIRLVHDDTRWTQWQRYSSRQDRRMEWEGIIGRAIYEGDITPFWSFLKFGELVQVGHGATFGLGKYRIDAAESPRDGHQSQS